MRLRYFAAIVGLALFGGGTGAVHAQTPDADYFRGKTVTYIVAVGPGGGYDTYGRLLTRFLPKYMPGTRFIVRNVPGAGHIVGANTIYTARPDGLTIGTFATGLIYTQLLAREGVRFDLAKMSWVGRMAEEGRSIVLASNSGMETPEDLINAEGPVLFASSGLGSTNHIEARMLAYALGFDVSIVPNMQNPEAQMSMVRGEVAAIVGSDSSFDNFVAAGSGTYLLSITDSGVSETGIPSARDYVVREDVLPLFDFIVTLSGLGRMTAGPPEIPAGRLAVLRDAFNKSVNDPELIAEARTLMLPLDPGTGEEVEARIIELLNQPPEALDMLERIAAE
jgi:tripartite-type tricarboxylate transporter receptor subunit TctC